MGFLESVAIWSLPNGCPLYAAGLCCEFFESVLSSLDPLRINVVVVHPAHKLMWDLCEDLLRQSLPVKPSRLFPEEGGKLHELICNRFAHWYLFNCLYTLKNLNKTCHL